MTAYTVSPPCAGKTSRARRFQAARLAAFSAAAAALLFLVPGEAQEKPPSQAPAQKEAPAQAAAPADNTPAEYVGSETCQTCHEDIFNAFQKNPHHLVETDRKYKAVKNACESCHGPGSKHAESMSAADIRNPGKTSPAVTDRICLKCHLNQTTHVGRINSSHAKSQVSCVACHSIHKNGPHGLVPQTRAETNKLCASCHSAVWASFQQPFRHRLPEGVMSCVDCHNPHGSLLNVSLQTFRGNEPGCLNCHGNLAGPFTFEHAPVRVEGCAACHMPHGSPNPRMLTRQQVRFVCLECHSNLPVPTPAANTPLGTVPPAFHDIRSPQFQNCTICHQKVHGSYVDRGLLR